MKKSITVLMCCIPGVAMAASNLRPTEQWAPGVTCWVDNTDYVMFHCNCIESMNSNTRAMFSGDIASDDVQPQSWAKCGTSSGNVSVDNKCVVGVAKQDIAYEMFRGTGSCDELYTHTVAYICAKKDRPAQEVCDCADTIYKHYTLQSDGITYKAQSTDVYFEAGSLKMSSYCCDEWPDPETGEYVSDCNDGTTMNSSKYTVGFNPNAITTSYACVDNYYYNGTKCVRCPEAIDMAGNSIRGYSENFNRSITGCYIKASDTIKNNAGVFQDETGEYGFVDDCHYSN